MSMSLSMSLSQASYMSLSQASYRPNPRLTLILLQVGNGECACSRHY